MLAKRHGTYLVEHALTWIEHAQGNLRLDGTTGGFRRTRYRGLARTALAGYLVAAAYNLVRMARLVQSQLANCG